MPQKSRTRHGELLQRQRVEDRRNRVFEFDIRNIDIYMSRCVFFLVKLCWKMCALHHLICDCVRWCFDVCGIVLGVEL